MRNRTALITGGSRGIGFAIAELFRRLGAKVLAPARNEMDLLSNESINDYLKALDEPVDILVNNAGINPLAEGINFADSDIERALQVNLVSPMKLIRGIVPLMISRNYGRIVNISSIFGSVYKSRRISYSTSKSALDGMTRGMAVELAQHNILVNAVAPGFVNTQMTRQNNTEYELMKIAESIPTGRLAEPAEISEVVAFLCSKKNSYITGQVISVDGGFTCQ